MIAYIEIPHQRPAKLYWYDDAAEVISAAITYAEQHDVAYDEPLEFQEAHHLLAGDLHGHFVVMDQADIEYVRLHVEQLRHQHHRIAPMIDELEAAFAEQDD
jgi:hypothetical protein